MVLIFAINLHFAGINFRGLLVSEILVEINFRELSKKIPKSQN